MLKSILLSLFFCCCGSGIVFSQGQMLQGIVVDFENAEELSGVAVTNKTRNITTLSDVDGKYSINIARGDQIEFSYIGYYTLSINAPSDSTSFRQITLKKKLFSLETVQIRPDWTPYQLDSINKRKIYSAALSRQKMSSSVLGTVFHPASALAEQFSKKSKQTFRFQKNFVKWENQHFVDTRYTFDEVAALTGLKGDTLAAFINAHPMPYDYARTATDLEIKMWIRYNYREWIKKPIVVPVILEKLVDTLQKE